MKTLKTAIAVIIMLLVAMSGFSQPKFANKKPGAPTAAAPAPVPVVGTTPAPVTTAPAIIPTAYSAEDSAGMINLVKGYLSAIAKKKSGRGAQFRDEDFKSFSFNGGEGTFIPDAALYVTKKPINFGKGADWFAKQMEQKVNSELNDFLPAIGASIKNWNAKYGKDGKRLGLVVIAACDEGEAGFGSKNLTAITQRMVYGKEQIGKILTYSMNIDLYDVIPVSIPGKEQYGKFIGIFLIDPTQAPAGDYGLNDVLYSAMGRFNAECNLKIALPLPTQQALIQVPATPAPAPTVTSDLADRRDQAPVIEIGNQKIAGSKKSFSGMFSSLGGDYSPFDNFVGLFDADLGVKYSVGTNPIYTGTNGTEVALKQLGGMYAEVSLWDDDKWLLTAGPTVGYSNTSWAFGGNFFTARRLGDAAYFTLKGDYMKLTNTEKTSQLAARAAFIYRSFEVSGFYQQVKSGGDFKFNENKVVAGSYDVGSYSAESNGLGVGYYVSFINDTYLLVGLDYFLKVKSEHVKNNIPTPNKSSGRWGVHVQLIF